MQWNLYGPELPEIFISSRFERTDFQLFLLHFSIDVSIHRFFFNADYWFLVIVMSFISEAEFPLTYRGKNAIILDKSRFSISSFLETLALISSAMVWFQGKIFLVDRSPFL